jgi:hypothetical protein
MSSSPVPSDSAVVTAKGHFYAGRFAVAPRP